MFHIDFISSNKNHTPQIMMCTNTLHIRVYIYIYKHRPQKSPRRFVENATGNMLTKIARFVVFMYAYT